MHKRFTKKAIDEKLPDPSIIKFEINFNWFAAGNFRLYSAKAGQAKLTVKGLKLFLLTAMTDKLTAAI